MLTSRCVRCKGARNLCGLDHCPILRRLRMPRVVEVREISSPSPPSVFVGRHGYPEVNVSPLVPLGDEVPPPDPAAFYGKPADEVITAYGRLIRPVFRVRVDRPREAAFLEEVALSARPVETEVLLEKPPRPAEGFDAVLHPLGPVAPARRARVVDNPVVPRRVDAVVEERVRAETALRELYDAGIPLEHMQRLLSAGLLGVKPKLVPTRWSITAVDDALGRWLAREVRECESVNSVELYTAEYYGNRISVVLAPGPWGFELVEAWMKGAVFAAETAVLSDYEGPEGRRGYAENTTGAYYAIRLAVLEHLRRRRRRAMAIVYREISPEYAVPIGVWVLRETTRDALSKKPRVFDSLRGAVRAVPARVEWWRKSVLLAQRRLDEFTELFNTIKQ